MKLIFEKSVPGRRGVRFSEPDITGKYSLDKKYLRAKGSELPEVSELDIVRHFTELSRLNFCVDTNFYPLGSCTMKYNPKILEKVSRLNGFTDTHPLVPSLPEGEEYTQGALEVLHDLQEMLCRITGMDRVTLQPLAGAHGELAGMLMIKAYHRSKNRKKKYVIVPDESHGTNPASAAMAGYEVLTVPTAPDGQMDMEEYKKKLSSDVAAVIMTCPSTLGIFNTRINEICSLAHSVDALMYYDGANMNAILGKIRPGDVGFDVVHINLHKTFSTPHGGGGPGAGPVGVKEELAPFLPMPVIVKRDSKFTLLDEDPSSIGRVAPFYGNFSVLLKAYAYILLLGKEGLIDVSEKAVLNANYIMESLKKYYELPYNRRCMHECVFSASRQAQKGVKALDIAKYLIDRGFHPPTIYFPLTVKEALMIEPTETESLQTLDKFIKAMIDAAQLSERDPDTLHNSPADTCVSRLDEAKAARELDINFPGING